ncbi:hypothetical protein PYR76_02230 [Acinetobacter soli]|nr:hypothetical protein [Acinetobacter soli]WEH92822.1 hypothetical protein PYR75_06185 [Acinetobacter soli]WEH97993.1 hypothetical protein PYR76_02230 [Acinetobacter soli]
MKLTKIMSFTAVISAAVPMVHADITVGVVTSSSGPVAMVGIPQRNTIALLPKKLARKMFATSHSMMAVIPQRLSKQ